MTENSNQRAMRLADEIAHLIYGCAAPYSSMENHLNLRRGTYKDWCSGRRAEGFDMSHRVWGDILDMVNEYAELCRCETHKRMITDKAGEIVAAVQPCLPVRCDSASQ